VPFSERESTFNRLSMTERSKLRSESDLERGRPTPAGFRCNGGANFADATATSSAITLLGRQPQPPARQDRQQAPKACAKVAF